MAKVAAFTPELLNALENLGIDPVMVSRVVIEIKAGEIPMIYVTRLGDRHVTEVVSALVHGEVQVVRTDEAEEEQQP